MLEGIGKQILAFVEGVGGVVLLQLFFMRQLLTGKLHWRNTLQQMSKIGVNSIGLVFVSSVFVGAVFTVQVVTEFSRLGALKLIGGIVGLALWRELGPVFTGLVVAGRVGASITAELGTMKVTDQIDAMRAMAIDPKNFLVAPRVAASIFMMPLLTGLADILGFLAGLFIAVYVGKINPISYFSSAQNMLHTVDIWGGLIKAGFFGLIIGSVACYNGLQATAGSEGVGHMTTRSVVTSFILVFVLNYIMSILIYS